MKNINSALLLLSALLVGLPGPSAHSAKAQPIFMEPSQNKDPAYAQLDLANRMNQWNIRQLGFQIAGMAWCSSERHP